MADGRKLNRRGFLRAAAGLAGAGFVGPTVVGARDQESGRQQGAGEATVRYTTGEPYEPAGKRLVFTNWLYVRPGSFGWYDAAGENITVRGSAALFEAGFRRSDCPMGIRLRAQPAQKTGPVFVPEKPWEDTFNVWTIIQDGSGYRGWSSKAYFESTDGAKWDRPLLGRVRVDGHDTNLHGFDLHNGTVFVDPSGPESERYKWVSEGSIGPEQHDEFRERHPGRWDPRSHRPDAGFYAAVLGGVSPDGITWSRLPEPLVVEHSDTQVTAYYDPLLRKYVLYTRNYMIAPRSEKDPEKGFRAWWDSGRRSIGRTESENFREFPLSEVILEPGPDMEPSDLLYTNCRTSIPGAPDLHLMFPAVWHAAVDDSTSILLASSSDGKVWNYVPGGFVFGTGECGGWDGGCVFAHPNLIELPNGDFALPYTGYTFPHKYPRGQWKYQTGYAVWPKGRLIALETDALGEFATVAMMPPGRKLRVNAVTKRAGSIRVEVAGPDRAPVAGRTLQDCEPLIGDLFRSPVTWKGQDDLGHPERSPIILRFRLDRARIFALDFE